MKTIVACFFVTLSVVVLGEPTDPKVKCVDKDCHQKCGQDVGYSVGLCRDDICECIPIETSQDVVKHEVDLQRSYIGNVIDAVTGDCNVISCVVGCLKEHKHFGYCLLGKCQCV